MKVSQLTRERLLEVLRYEPEDGSLYWRVTQGRAIKGMLAGNKRPDGYRYIKIDKALYRSTRLIWLYVHGEWPCGEIDHANGDTTDDRIGNLRDSTHSQNLGNRKKNKNNTSGFKGVYRKQGRYRSYINKDNKRFWLGYYSTAEEAHAAYMVAATRLFGEFARSS